MTRLTRIPWLTIVVLVLSGLNSFGQRSYTSTSVLASGSWYKISVNAPGVYRIDLPFLSRLGIPTNNLSSASFRLFGNGGGMNSENPAGSYVDDLIENPVFIQDGGDGILSGNDYILFYAPGPHHWQKDSANTGFRHIKNLYSEESFFYISFAGNGIRIPQAQAIPGTNVNINSFNDRYFHELDTINFLSSGKDWFGEEFSNLPGKTLSLSFPLEFPGIEAGTATVNAKLLARSFNTGSRFNLRINGQPLTQVDLPAVGNGIYDAFARVQTIAAAFTGNGNSVNLAFDYNPGGFNAQGWLDWFTVQLRRQLTMAGTQQLLFRDLNSVLPGHRGSFTINGAAAETRVWDVTDPVRPFAIATTLNGNQMNFTADCSVLREYIAFNSTGFLQPQPVGRVENQNLHGQPFADYLIITHTSLLGQAQRLASYHQQQNQLRTLVITTDQIYNEFSSGVADPSAVRDFVKMFYDRANGDSLNRPKYLLLFGDGSFDYKKRIAGNTNFVPVYESAESLAPLETYTSDDFFGFLDNDDNINTGGTHLLDIGIGRIPAGNDAQARAIVDKITGYHTPASLGPWRTEMTYIADDEDNNLHLEDAETITKAVAAITPGFNQDKIYLDAYQQESGPAGSRYPLVNQAIINRMFSGNLVWNYTGHGGARRLADEVVLDQDIINTFSNSGKLPLFITATCDFAPHDNPLVASIGENLLLRERTGAIALMTTTRLVFAYSNRIMNENYLKAALQRNSSGRYPTLGQAVRSAKNTTYTNFSDVINNRKFTLIGDPALTIGYPVQQVRTTAVNGMPFANVPDTLKALSTYTIAGEVLSPQGALMTDFTGTVYPVIFDKVQNVTTLGNDAGSIKTAFTQQKNIIFRGKATVTNGKFNFNFVVPKDIDYKFGNGRISYYTENGATDGAGATTNIIVGGTGSGTDDKNGPDLKPFLNDEKFIDGGATIPAPMFVLKLSDSSGINVMGSGT
ncbi:MAG: type IX secretion system sortase PorU, partial [Flavitalea sp.]